MHAIESPSIGSFKEKQLTRASHSSKSASWIDHPILQLARCITALAGGALMGSEMGGAVGGLLGAVSGAALWQVAEKRK